MASSAWIMIQLVWYVDVRGSFFRARAPFVRWVGEGIRQETGTKDRSKKGTGQR